MRISDWSSDVCSSDLQCQDNVCNDCIAIKAWIGTWAASRHEHLPAVILHVRALPRPEAGGHIRSLRLRQPEHFRRRAAEGQPHEVAPVAPPGPPRGPRAL